MPWIPREEIERLRKIDLLTYLRQCEPWELKKVSGSEYRMKSHDSISISHGLWHRWSRGSLGGKSALDYLIKVKGMDFLEAAEVLRKSRLMPDAMPAERNFSFSFQLPQENETQEEVHRYLCKERGIDEEIFYDFLAKGKIYEEKTQHMAVFVGFTEDDRPAYAALRSTGKDRIVREVKGSRKICSFRQIGEDRQTLHLFESAIDLLSFLSLRKMEKKSWRNLCCISLGGVGGKTLPPALQDYLWREKRTRKIVTHFDRDVPGMCAAQSMGEILCHMGYEIEISLPQEGKDVNDELQSRRKERNSDSYAGRTEADCQGKPR